MEKQFLGIEAPYCEENAAAVWVLPAPLEATVSYGHGTAAGPGAIITASHQVELYDREFGSEPALVYGVHTLPSLSFTPSLETALKMIAEATCRTAENGKLAVALGGEHTVTVGGVRGVLAGHRGPLTIIQLDAHCDLRSAYGGCSYSHACVARRLLEEPGVERIVQLGIRSLCREEAQFIEASADRVTVFYAEDIHRDNWQEAFTQQITGKSVYITIDVDGLDPSVIPATGTPEPGGLSWQEALDILRLGAGHADVVGLDCVELAPAPDQHMADFATAKLIYKAMSYALLGGKGPGRFSGQNRSGH